jgi:amino acid transporter
MAALAYLPWLSLSSQLLRRSPPWPAERLSPCFLGTAASFTPSPHISWVEGQGAAGLQQYLGGLQPDPTAFLFALGQTYIGTALTTVMSLLFISSVFAALLAFHNAVARYLYALGREGLVPEQLDRTHTKHLSPHAGSLSQSVLAFVVVLVFVLTTQDPVLALFTWLTQLGTLGIIVLMALASFAVIAFFARHRDFDSNMFRTTIAPIVGGLAMSAVAIYAAS